MARGVYYAAVFSFIFLITGSAPLFAIALPYYQEPLAQAGVAHRRAFRSSRRPQRHSLHSVDICPATYRQPDFRPRLPRRVGDPAHDLDGSAHRRPPLVELAGHCGVGGNQPGHPVGVGGAGHGGRPPAIKIRGRRVPRGRFTGCFRGTGSAPRSSGSTRRPAWPFWALCTL